ncbi:short transient receptor potential channel 5-like isoform X3 [Tigriopus californicus]|uniref:short transient receptor potential channel 5-like isoform X3 n=1 Tax=Tigriopus californicus TaxID=6832 RepID=UPI0027DA9F86|nr:short transient receptor potential channel 5-like isoform X3 [Tigriopus californicus]
MGNESSTPLERFYRDDSVLGSYNESKVESEFLDFIRNDDPESILKVIDDPGKTVTLSQNWNFIKRCTKEVVGTGNKELIRAVLEVLTDTNPKSFDVGELFIMETLEAGESDLVICVLEYWMNHDLISSEALQGVSNALDVIHNSVYFAANRRLKDTTTLILAQTAVYCATVDQATQILQDVLQWHEEHSDVVGQSTKLNADAMIHAALEDDRERLAILYSYGYRLGTDTDRRINKDYLKRIKLFKARASPVYKSVVFENSKDIYKDDPLKKCFEYARQARINADKIQDFTKEYTDIAKKCEEFAKGLLDRCTTKHEVQTLLQTRSYRGHTDANFNIAILDGHKEFVAHEKFQQLLHKKWGQRDRLQSSNVPSYNIFWSEKSSLSKAIHILLQVVVFIFLPIVYCIPMFGQCGRRVKILNWFLQQGQIPVNRFIYGEISKGLFFLIVLLTLISEDDVEWYDLLAVCWILSYLLENFRTIHRLYRFGGSSDSKRIFKRWCTFRNLYILATDIVFLVSLILRSVAHFSDQCRAGCPYKGNEIAFVAASIWSFAAVLCFLRSIQGGLMWRQTGPVIISISYMILDVLVFLFVFVIVYIAFTLAMVYVYHVYSDDRTKYFNSYKMAFKLFFWAMIRTGNPQYADILVYNSTKTFNTTCLQSLVSGVMSLSENLSPSEVEACSTGFAKGEIEEGIPYIAGNTLWAFYQFTVVIVLLSILRARMVNTYHRVFKEADVQWKFFRASIWWKYLDEDSILPPPYTILYFLHRLAKFLNPGFKECQKNHTEDTPQGRRNKHDLEELIELDKREFEKRYKTLMLMLISPQHTNKNLNRHNNWTSKMSRPMEVLHMISD